VEPDWLGSPKHFITGAILAAIVAFLASRSSTRNVWIAAGLAVGVTMTVEAIVEIAEYPLKYQDDPNLTAYYDTLADLAGSLAGAVVGAALGIALRGGIIGGESDDHADPGDLQELGVAKEDPGATSRRDTRRG
jgi:hypothetical protein